MADSTSRSVGYDISQYSFGSDETKIMFDSGHSIFIEGSINSSTELLSRNIVTGTVADNEIVDEQQETQRKRLEKTAKLLCGVALNLSIAIIIAIVANTNKSGFRSHRELIVFKASATLALLTFFAGLGLLISVQYKNVRRTVQLGLIIMAVITIFAGVVGLAMNIVF